MNIWILIGIAIFLFAFMTFARRWHDYSILFTIAIGFAVNANIYNSSTNPVYVGNIIFAIDSILYVGFTFSVLICVKEYGMKQAIVLTTSTIAAIIVSAAIELFAHISSDGYDPIFLKSFFSYLFSALGTAIGISLMLFIFKLLDNKKLNIYVIFIICSILANILNTIVYYVFSVIVYGNIANLGYILLGSYIGKAFSIILGIISYFINKHYWIPIDLQNKENNNDNIEE
jgi:hypothetical protein